MPERSALYRRYRPQTFSAIVGQEHVTRTLRNAIASGQVAHAYLLAGSRGIGKTTIARLIAKAVNCTKAKDGEPCDRCENCVAIREGRFLDLIEIDAASNRGIDEMRDLREKVRFAPSQGQYKVYVIDEAHQLTNEAFNALLKTLEEPPPHIIFVLATTEAGRIPGTIVSRTQRFDLRRIPFKGVVQQLAAICEQEKMTAEPAALEAIARHAQGSLRDAESILDMVGTFSASPTSTSSSASPSGRRRARSSTRSPRTTGPRACVSSESWWMTAATCGSSSDAASTTCARSCRSSPPVRHLRRRAKASPQS